MGGAAPIGLALETGKKRVFASALDWPGWSRSGRHEAAAVSALLAAAPRYEAVARAAGEPFAAPSSVAGFVIVERLAGNASTDFGVPAARCPSDAEAIDAGEADRLARLVRAAWQRLDAVVAGAPAELRKGPRGGGRDRDRITRHVVESDAAYAPKLGIKVRSLGLDEPGGPERLRDALEAALRASGGSGRATVDRAGKGWPVRYAARRIAWHALDHAWEIEDRTPALPPS